VFKSDCLSATSEGLLTLYLNLLSPKLNSKPLNSELNKFLVTLVNLSLLSLLFVVLE